MTYLLHGIPTATLDLNLPIDYYHMTLAAEALLLCAAIPAFVFATNLLFFRRPGPAWNKRVLPSVSVLIPARDEEGAIGGAIEAVLASRGVDIEVIVLDDASTDRTAEIVRAAAEADPRVRLESAPPLPEGWNGKQHACWVLASLAKHDVFCFLDADVRLGPEAIYRMAGELNFVEGDEPEMALVSGFPRQETGTFLEKLLLPMIHFVLLGFLPLAGERWTRWSAFAAGCGQFMMVRREPYFSSGGHSANPMTMHDGLRLPRLFRRHGFRTGLFDLGQDAACRMYRSAGEVWRGLAKNATEGMASVFRLPLFSVLLLLGQVLPLVMVIYAGIIQYVVPQRIALVAMLLGYGMRCFDAWRYRQSRLGVLFHPLGVLILLVLQWYALFGKLFGFRATWKQREYRVG
jgi:glycosyltransferase involved in cell wall biosynthesis